MYALHHSAAFGGRRSDRSFHEVHRLNTLHYHLTADPKGQSVMVAIRTRSHRGRGPRDNADLVASAGPRGFTLMELLVVMTIILIVSAVALPTILPALSHRQVSEGARLLQAALSGARDSAIRDNSLSGIRLLADPAIPGAFNRFIPLSQPPSYTEGLVSIVQAPASYPANVLLGTAALVLEESIVTTVGGVPVLNDPVSWAWNVRQGDAIRFANSGVWYTVAGPITSANPENFINYGAPGAVSPIVRTVVLPNGQTAAVNPEYLLLVNGADDNANGYIDEGWDGVDNNADGVVDNVGLIDPTGQTKGEWEQETWQGYLAAGANNLPYTIRRRPIPGLNAREVLLPTNVVVNTALSNLPASTADLVVKPDGKWSPSLQYGVPSSITMGGEWFQFWLSERSDIGAVTPQGSWWLLSLNGKTGRVNSVDSPDPTTGLATARQQ
jgi:prepilin-type N-terminal cleavage/methylation domain-containing protein